MNTQCQLFHSIKPLFANKPVMLVMNKIDVTRLDDLAPRKMIPTLVRIERHQGAHEDTGRPSSDHLR